MEDTMETTEYNGWKNYATWNLHLWLGSVDAETYNYWAKYARTHDVASLTKHLSGYLTSEELDATAKGVVTDWLGSSTRWVQWKLVTDALVTDKVPVGTAVGATRKAWNLLIWADWEDIIAGSEYEVEKDERLQNWVQEQVTTWVESPDARAYHGTALWKYCTFTIKQYLEAVDWNTLHETLAED